VFVLLKNKLLILNLPMDSLITTFHLDWKLMVAQAINFAIVILVLYFFALKPLKKLMDERTQTITGGLDNAKKQEELLKAQQEEYDKTLAKARAEAQAIMKDVKKDAEDKRAQLLAIAQDESKAILENGKKQLEGEKEKMLDEAKKELVSLVVSATKKVLGENVSETIEAKLVEDSIGKIK
jgi:F-type H+-transporting ATPase subunit b